MSACVFLDRDGVINKDYVDYTYTLERFEVLPGVIEGLKALKEAGFLLVVVTNQSGIAKGIYKHEDVHLVHDHFQELTGGLIDRFYYSPTHQTISASLSRKPGTLMFEKAIAKFDIDTTKSWMIGDRERDMQPAKKMGIKTILLPEEGYDAEADYKFPSFKEAVSFILSQKP